MLSLLPLALLEVADKITHPSAGAFWLASIGVAGVACGLDLVMVRRAFGSVLAAFWLVGTAGWIAMHWLDGTDIIVRDFRNEMRTGYFVSLALAAIVPLVMRRATRSWIGLWRRSIPARSS